jgi:hypothetical protein
MCRPIEVKCFKCYEWFNKTKQHAPQCKECGDFQCPHCKACMCNLTPEEQMIVMAMIRSYEKFIEEELKVPDQNYDYSIHEEIETKFKKG